MIKYYMAIKGQEWEPCKAKTLLGAKREDTKTLKEYEKEIKTQQQEYLLEVWAKEVDEEYLELGFWQWYQFACLERGLYNDISQSETV